MQYFRGLKGFRKEAISDPSLFETIHKRIGVEKFDELTVRLLERVKASEKQNQEAKSRGKKKRPGKQGENGS